MKIPSKIKIIIKRFEQLNFKNKIFFSTLAVILLISLGIAFVARWVVISNLTSQLKKRGMGIAQSVAENSRSYILTEDSPELTSLVYDASQLGERKLLIAYIYILNKEGSILADTFISKFPEKLIETKKDTSDQVESIKLVQINRVPVYDISVPVREGIYQIGTVHVGLKKNAIDQLIAKLRATFLGFIIAIVILFFGISHWLSKYITMPMSQLIMMSDEIGRGNLNIKQTVGIEVRCWEVKNCDKQNCPAFCNTSLPCWYVEGTMCEEYELSKFPAKLKMCYDCIVYKKYVGDEVVQLAHSFSNMTFRLKSSKKELRESEKKYRSLFDSGPNPILVVSQKTNKILDANTSAEATYGYSKEELTKMLFSNLDKFAYNDFDLEYFEKDGQSKAFIVNSKVQHYKKGGKPFYVNVYACPARYQDRDAMIIATTDLTEMIEKDTQLIQASKMKTLGEMSAGVAHELNQPLNAIKMGGEFLKVMIEKNQKIPEQDLFHVVDEISIQVDRAAEIINHLREFSRKADFTKEKIYINRSIRGVINILEKQLNIQNIEVKLDVDETIPPILAHNNRLEQVFFNLITNARDAINQKQKDGVVSNNRVISIRSFMQDDRVTVAVSDTGTGIAGAVKERIFEAFFTTKDIKEGMGLGLSIIHGIISDYGGDIEVKSEEGIGTTFILTFPCAPK